MLRDPEFGPIRIRMFGSYCIRVADAAKFIKEIVGTDGHFVADELTGQLRNLIVSRSTDLVAESKIPVLDMAANYDELGVFISERIHDDFEAYGLDVTKILVENISLPPAVEEVLDKRTSMGIIGNLNAYTQFQAANAMEAAAENSGGDAGAGIGMGMGFAMANQMGQALGGQSQAQQAATPAPGGPPPIPQATAYFAAVDGQQTGPFDVNTLRQQAQSGQLSATTLVWSQGMAEWTEAGKVPDLAGSFGQAPPPIPQG